MRVSKWICYHQSYHQLELFRTGRPEFREIIFQEMEAWLAGFVLSFKIKAPEFRGNMARASSRYIWIEFSLLLSVDKPWDLGKVSTTPCLLTV